MANHKDALSESEQMYLISIARMVEDGAEGPVPIAAIAETLSVQPVSVNQMARKLEEAGWLVYRPYKGVELTPHGRRIATRALRYRRLWEVFLVHHLKLGLEEAGSLACCMEHETNDDVAERLSRFLGDPLVSPAGKPIPGKDNQEFEQTWLALSQLQVGQRGQVVQIDSSQPARSFLTREGIHPGARLAVVALGSSGHLLLDVGGLSVTLAQEVADCISVQLEENPSKPIRNKEES